RPGVSDAAARCSSLSQRPRSEDAVSGEEEKRAAHRALVHTVLNAEAVTSREQRAGAYDGAGLPPPLDLLVDKVATRSAPVTEADLAAAKASGCSEDELFELVVCAAVGQSTRMYEAGLAALA